MPRIPAVEAPSAFMTPISRVFSTTIIEKIARMPNPATAMMKNKQDVEDALLDGDGTQERPLLLFPGVDPEKRGLELVQSAS